jgi:hypothetical protein
VAFAGWAGLLVTALNLIPVGTLDGGHVIYALFGDKSRRAFLIIIVMLFGLGWFWNGWWIWMALLFWLGRVHEPRSDHTAGRYGSRSQPHQIVSLTFGRAILHCRGV